MLPLNGPKRERAAPAGPATLEVPDLLAMIQPSFWHTDDLTAMRYCALTVLIACCHILPGHARGILLANWRPVIDGAISGTVRIWRHHEWQTVHLTPQTVFVVERYLAERASTAERKGWTSKFMFTSSTGRQLHYVDVDLGLKRLRKTIESQTTIPRMLKNLCVRVLKGGGDEVASRRFRGLGKPHAEKHNLLPVIPDARIVRLVRRTNPLKDLDRQVRSEEAALRWLQDRKKDLKVPLRLTVKSQVMPKDHPVVAALLRYEWPRAERARGDLRSTIWRRYGDDINRLLVDRVLTADLVARLLHTEERAVSSHVHRHYRTGIERPLRTFRQRKAKPKPTPEDRATIEAIQRVETPADPTGSPGAIALHLPAIEDMIARGVLTSSRAAKLFDIGAQEMLIVRCGAKLGIDPDKLIGRARCARIPEVWWERIRISLSAHPDEGRIPFYCRMVAAGFPGGFSTLGAHVDDLRREPAPEPLTDGERKTIARLTATRWSSIPKIVRGQRRDAIRSDLAAIDAMVTARKLGIGEGADLLNLSGQRLTFFRLGLRAGLCADQVAAAPTPVTKAVWEVVEREHALTPDEPDATFYWRMRAEHGFTGGLKLVANHRNFFRRHGAAVPIEHTR